MVLYCSAAAKPSGRFPQITRYSLGMSSAVQKILEVATARLLPHQALATHRDKLRQLADRYRFSNLRVFGSAARGDDHPGSDLDLLVTLPQDAGLLTVASFVEEATEFLGVEVDVVSDSGLRSDPEILTSASTL